MVVNTRNNQVLAQEEQWYVTATDRSRGLLRYEKAPENFVAIFKLPLFGFFPLVHCFGMKFSIDIVFCDSNKRVVYLKKEVAPNRIVMPWRFIHGGCRYLLEFSQANTKDLFIGDQLSWGRV